MANSALLSTWPVISYNCKVPWRGRNHQNIMNWDSEVNLIKKFKTTGSIARTSWLRETFKEYQRNKDDHWRTDEGRQWNNNYPTTHFANWNGLPTFKENHSSLQHNSGMDLQGSTCCHLFREAKKLECLEWAQQYPNYTFDNVMWTDESLVQLETYRRFCCRKKKELPRNNYANNNNNHNDDK